MFSCFNFLSHLYEGSPGAAEASEWSELSSNSAIFSMQGRRPGNEDRAVIRRVETVEGVEEREGEGVTIWAVMDGHGGHFCADYAAAHLITNLERSVKKLKLLTSKLGNLDKLKLYQVHFGEASKAVIKYLDISDEEINKLKDKKVKEEDETNGNDETEEKNKEKEVEEKSTPGDQLVLSSRMKPLEELPTVKSPEKKTKFKPKLKPKTPKTKTKLETSKEITDYINSSGEILYPKLIHDEINACDKEMLEAAKKANSIGGTTLILALLDSDQLWVGNVGDSRAVFGNECGVAVPMSYDHKPAQLKEKKRIQEAGGFVAMNGVWRVMGVLATSRAMGDYPLKDKGVVVSDPDVLSFSLKDHRMQFAVLASDGLWDTHTNEEAVSMIKSRLSKDKLMGAETLARDAFSRGSLDNITVLVVDLSRFKK